MLSGLVNQVVSRFQTAVAPHWSWIFLLFLCGFDRNQVHNNVTSLFAIPGPCPGLQTRNTVGDSDSTPWE